MTSLSGPLWKAISPLWWFMSSRARVEQIKKKIELIKFHFPHKWMFLEILPPKERVSPLSLKGFWHWGSIFCQNISPSSKTPTNIGPAALKNNFAQKKFESQIGNLSHGPFSYLMTFQLLWWNYFFRKFFGLFFTSDSFLTNYQNSCKFSPTFF